MMKQKENCTNLQPLIFLGASNALIEVSEIVNDINSISGLDLQLTKQIDAIYKDIDFIKELD